jgi:hypothetical protein
MVNRPASGVNAGEIGWEMVPEIFPGTIGRFHLKIVRSCHRNNQLMIASQFLNRMLKRTMEARSTRILSSEYFFPGNEYFLFRKLSLFFIMVVLREGRAESPFRLNGSVPVSGHTVRAYCMLL